MKKIDFTKPIESTQFSKKGQVSVVYCGVQTIRDGKPIDDQYRHMVLVGNDQRANYLDDFGRSKGDKLNRIMVRNVEEEPKKKPAPADKTEAGDGSSIVLAEEIRELRSDLEGFVSELKPLLYGLAQAIKTSGDSQSAALDKIRKELVDGLLLVAEEAKRPKPEPVETAADRDVPLPPPQPHREKPVAIVKDLSQLSSAIGGKPPIKGLDGVSGRLAQETLKLIALGSGVRSVIVLRSYIPAGARGRAGELKFVGEQDGGLRCRVYGDKLVTEVLVYVDHDAKNATLALIEQLGRRKA